MPTDTILKSKHFTGVRCVGKIYRKKDMNSAIYAQNAETESKFIYLTVAVRLPALAHGLNKRNNVNLLAS